ncbi:MAG: ATP-binding protein [Candidatus Thermoplasmatota archaeon]|nr:ATP-binding protein [Candidatus Thermoplasmatota archaeon]
MPSEIRALGEEDGELKEVDIKTIHEFEEVEGSLPLFKESEGTRRFFSLLGPIITALNNGEVLVIDELDTKLHHLLNKFIIKLFHDLEENNSNAQLIFTTHNTNLLDQDLFRRDQVRFTERKPEIGSTDLYSLVEYSPRKDKDIEKGYLVGRYGAIPFIGDEKILEEGS